MNKQGHRELVPISGSLLQEAESTLDKSPVHRRDTQDNQPCSHTSTPKGNLERSINLTVMFLDCGRKTEPTNAPGEHANCRKTPSQESN
ncbi:hypothetical protein CHARACLAT_016633 [Characodon lateralis]|uniref:Prolactin receptor n=1 Tax=Characodon lateralis TaxID=208331 RepID=A0ABU7EUR0_9TELE|nr:hypothetical protein [Characodon lateralis]